MRSSNYVCNILVMSTKYVSEYDVLTLVAVVMGTVVHRNRSKVKYGNLRRWRMRE